MYFVYGVVEGAQCVSAIGCDRCNNVGLLCGGVVWS